MKTKKFEVRVSSVKVEDGGYALVDGDVDTDKGKHKFWQRIGPEGPAFTGTGHIKPDEAQMAHLNSAVSYALPAFMETAQKFVDTLTLKPSSWKIFVRREGYRVEHAELRFDEGDQEDTNEDILDI